MSVQGLLILGSETFPKEKNLKDISTEEKGVGGYILTCQHWLSSKNRTRKEEEERDLTFFLHTSYYLTYNF